MATFMVRVKETTYHTFKIEDASNMSEARDRVYAEFCDYEKTLVPYYSENEGPTIVKAWELNEIGETVHQDSYE